MKHPNEVRESLLEAARLVESACAAFDLRRKECEACGTTHFANPRDAKFFERIGKTGEKLRAVAEQIQQDILSVQRSEL